LKDNGWKEPGVKETSFTEFWVLKGEVRPSTKGSANRNRGLDGSEKPDSGSDEDDESQLSVIAV